MGTSVILKHLKPAFKILQYYVFIPNYGVYSHMAHDVEKVPPMGLARPKSPPREGGRMQYCGIILDSRRRFRFRSPPAMRRVGSIILSQYLRELPSEDLAER